MIKNITIENFRCFQKTHISNISQVNLITGRNNSGKTAFLEALYLINSPNVSSIMFLKKLRRENLDFLDHSPEKAWDNFFYNQQNKQTIKLTYELMLRTLVHKP